MGSGHILVYAFDVFMQIYEAQGFTQRDAAQRIVEHNLYGLEIDKRAYQLAYFAVMMKARQYDRRFFSRGIAPQLYCPTGYPDGAEFGSLLVVDKLEDKPQEDTERHLFTEKYADELNRWNFRHLLAQKYDVVCTNPPYMGASNMNAKLSEFIKKNYTDSKSDLFAAFIEKGNVMTKYCGYNCMVTMQSWMFLSSFEKMRIKILQMRDITNLMHMENMVMGIAFGTGVTVIRNSHLNGYKGTYNQIKLADIKDNEPLEFPVMENRFAQVSANIFSKIPGSPVAYWVSENFIKAFEMFVSLQCCSVAKSGLSTGNNDLFMKLWFEISKKNIAFGMKNDKDFLNQEKKYVPCNKGGLFRKWYGNNEYIIDWTKSDKMHRPRTTYKDLYYKPGITWSVITSGLFSARLYRAGFLFDHAAASLFVHNKENEKYILSFLNTNVSQYILWVINPTLNTGADVVLKLPIVIRNKDEINILTQCNIELAKLDWDSYETSWDFKKHPLI